MGIWVIAVFASFETGDSLEIADFGVDSQVKRTDKN